VRARKAWRGVADRSLEHVSPDERGQCQGERDPELVPEHRDAVARMSIGSGLCFLVMVGCAVLPVCRHGAVIVVVALLSSHPSAAAGIPVSGNGFAFTHLFN